MLEQLSADVVYGQDFETSATAIASRIFNPRGTERAHFSVVICLAAEQMMSDLSAAFPKDGPERPSLQSQFSIDFEFAAFQEAQSAFLNEQLFECLFHVTRNMKKKITD